jgi:hypothetical protein
MHIILFYCLGESAFLKHWCLAPWSKLGCWLLEVVTAAPSKSISRTLASRELAMAVGMGEEAQKEQRTITSVL